MAFLDFAALKESVKIEDTIAELGLTMKEGNGQFRGTCPACTSSGPCSLVITPVKQAFYCFEAKTGGDVIALAAHIKGCSMKDAAQILSGESAPSDTVPRERSKKAARSLQPLSYLESDHSKLERFNLSIDTLEHFGAGYAPKGIMRGKLAVPIHDEGGKLVGYFGVTPEDGLRGLIFPKEFEPAELLFNVHRVDDETILLCRHPIDVLAAWQNGVENTVALLTPTISAEQLLLLSDTSKRLGKTPFEIP